MQNKCIYDCRVCGRCAMLELPILDTFDDITADCQRSAVKRRGYGIAIDLGTTNIALALIDLSNGAVCARHTLSNPQRRYGVDVISRIEAANNGALEEMRDAVTSAFSNAASALAVKSGIEPGAVSEVIIAGNTVMIHLLLELDCKPLGVIPFASPFTLKHTYSFGEIVKGSSLNCNTCIVPWLSGFVGGDITAALVYVWRKNLRRFMLIDLGTNGELALYNDGELYITATAAGPAFEGGTGGSASEILSELARALREDIIDETGKLTDESDTFLDQKDIRALQLAKSAVRTGIELLLEQAGISYNDLDALFLAGGIGQAINIPDAAETGLIPTELTGKTTAVGNASLGGAAVSLLSEDPAARFGQLKEIAVEINLSAHPRFNEVFTDYMYFD